MGARSVDGRGSEANKRWTDFFFLLPLFLSSLLLKRKILQSESDLLEIIPLSGGG